MALARSYANRSSPLCWRISACLSLCDPVRNKRWYEQMIKPAGTHQIRKTIQKKPLIRTAWFSMAGVLGFEPRKCQIQSLVPYRLAIPQCLVRNDLYSTEEQGFCQQFSKKIISFSLLRSSILLLPLFSAFPSRSSLIRGHRRQIDQKRTLP